eukprot:20415-Heterococcus_DN1.PRE.2
MLLSTGSVVACTGVMQPELDSALHVTDTTTWTLHARETYYAMAQIPNSDNSSSRDMKLITYCKWVLLAKASTHWSACAVIAAASHAAVTSIVSHIPLRTFFDRYDTTCTKERTYVPGSIIAIAMTIAINAYSRAVAF